MVTARDPTASARVIDVAGESVIDGCGVRVARMVSGSGPGRRISRFGFDGSSLPTVWTERRALLMVAIIAVTLLTTSGCSRTVPPDQLADPEGIQAVDELLDDAVNNQLIPGAVVLVSRRGEILHRRAYGFARLYDFGGERVATPMPMSTEHVFDLASLTKVFATTLGVMMLVNRGEMDLDASVSEYLQSFTGPAKDSISVRHLLTHSAGLFPWKPIYFHAVNRDQALDYIAALPLAYPVGRARHYSDLGFMLLGYLIEEKSGQPLDVFLRTELYQPLGLSRTAFVPKKVGLKGPFAATSHGNPFERRMVTDDNFGYRVDEDSTAFDGWRNDVLEGEVNDGNAFHAHGGVAGHAGLFSTADDLRVLLELMLARGSLNGRHYFGNSDADIFLARDEFGNGLGWAMSPDVLRIEDPPQGAFGHTGFTGTYAAAFPTTGTGLIMLTNRQNLGVGRDGRYNSLDELRTAVATAVLEATGR